MSEVQSAGANLCQVTLETSGAGTVLRDLEALLDFVGEAGIRSTGKYHLLPMAGLFDLDARMSHPLRPRLKRPQQKSFAHLNGLYLLARTVEMIIPRGSGKTKGTIAVDAEIARRWRELNPTEQYFNLLEACFLHSSWETVGGRSGVFSEIASELLRVWENIPLRREQLADNAKWSDHLFYGWQGATCLALLELFGLVSMERGAADEGESWRVRSLQRTEFGQQLMDLLPMEHYWRPADDEEPVVGLGQWQKRLQPQFPQWVNNLALPDDEFREGVFVLTVSLDRIWRKIAIVAEADLLELADAIIEAFEFDGDHLYDFYVRARNGRQITVGLPMDEFPGLGVDKQLDEFAVGYLPLHEGESMTFNYDYGAGWKFDVRLEKVEPDDGSIQAPAVIASHGDAPSEYGHWDDEE